MRSESYGGEIGFNDFDLFLQVASNFAKLSMAQVVQTNTSPYAHTRTLLAAHARTPDVITRLAQGQVVFVECSFHAISSCFLITYRLPDATRCLTDATDWNQIKPLCSSALGWTVWPSSRSDPKHTSLSCVYRELTRRVIFVRLCLLTSYFTTEVPKKCSVHVSPLTCS